MGIHRSILRIVGILFLWIPAVAALGGCSGKTEDAATKTAARAVWLRLLPVPNEAAAGSGEPNLALGDDGSLLLSWVEPAGEKGHALRFAAWRENGWGPAGTVASGDDWFVNWADFPSIAALRDGTLAAHWLRKSASDTYAYDVVLSFSTDGGTTWSEPVRPHQDGTATEHGFVSLVPLEDRFLAVWLDGRETGKETGGAMTLRAARVDASGRLEGETLLDDRTCDCCPTTALRLEDGEVLVGYRDRSPEEVRDIALVRFDGESWSKPAFVHEDGWTIAGCPVNGPALAAEGDRVACAWFTVSGDPGEDGAGETQPEVRVAFSEDRGRHFGEPIRVDLGRPLGRVDLVMLDDGSALVSWMEEGGNAGEIRVRRVRPEGADPGAFLVARPAASRASGFPKMVRRGDGVALAWNEPGTEAPIHTAILSLGS